jgi:uncharacterized protein (DUF2062 family)
MKFFKNLLNRLLAMEKSPHKLALGCCLGIFMAMSPFLGIQTWLAIPLSWLFGVSTLLVIAVLYLVNNPFTMFPIVVADYAVGHCIIERWMGMDLTVYNPSWMGWINSKIGPTLYKYLGVTQVCFWCYILGGLLLATICSLPLYPVLKKFFAYKLQK